MTTSSNICHWMAIRARRGGRDRRFVIACIGWLRHVRATAVPQLSPNFGGGTDGRDRRLDMGRLIWQSCHIRVGGGHQKPIAWVGSAKKDLKAMPEEVQNDFGYVLDLAQHNEQAAYAEQMKGDLRDVFWIRMEYWAIIIAICGVIAFFITPS